MDGISKMTRTIPIQRIDLKSIAAAFLDHCVAAHGPPARQFSDTGPQFRFTTFQGIRSLLEITNRYSRTYHRQTNGQVERYNGTIVEQLRTFVEDHQYRWDALVSMLTLAFNSRPQQSTEVAPLDSVTPKWVGSLSVERVVGSPAPEEQDRSPRGVREAFRARLRNLVHKVRRPLSVAHRRYKRNYDACVRTLNKDIQAGDRVFIEFHARTKQKLGTQAAGPHKVQFRGEGTFSLDIGGYPMTGSRDQGTAAPDRLGDLQKLIQNLGAPQDVVVPVGHHHTGRETVLEAFVGHEVADDRTLRLWTRWWVYYASEDTLELASRIDLRKGHQYMRRVGLLVEEAVAVVEFLDQGNALPGGKRGFQVLNLGGPSANDTCFVAGHEAASGTMAAVRQRGDPQHGHGVGRSQSGIVDVAGRGGCDGKPLRTGVAVAVLAESRGDPVRGAERALVGDMKLIREKLIGR